MEYELYIPQKWFGDEFVQLREECHVPEGSTFSSLADGNRNYMKPGSEIWLYLRKYADDEIKYFICNARQTSLYRNRQNGNVKKAN